MNLLYIIPSYEPTGRLLAIVKELFDEVANLKLVVVDDGSGPNFRSIFDETESLGAIVLRHAVNLGKGRALKTAFNWFLNHTPDYDGMVTLDSDGQHKLVDIKKCADFFSENPDALILGSRDFDAPQVPFKSRAGNKITRTVLRFLCGIRLEDSQTGLRVIPRAFVAPLMLVSGERFDYETNMLLEAKKLDITIREIRILTIYENGNRGSHFSPLRDSILVYATFAKFMLSSTASSCIDLILYTLAVILLKDVTPHYILISAAAARVCSSLFNYNVNKGLVFRNRGRLTFVKYYILATCQLLASGLGATWVFSRIPFINEIGAKIAVDIVLFLCSFVIQRTLVFREKRVEVQTESP